jgi:hypothetical protein
MSTTVEQAAPPACELAELAFFTGAWEADGTFHATPFSSQKPISWRSYSRASSSRFPPTTSSS